MSCLRLLSGLLLFLAVPVVALPAASAQVDPFAAFACERAFDEGRFAEAVEVCRPLAAEGLADAQAVMGRLSQDGRGVPRDYTEAARWYKAAAGQGHIESQFSLGTMYRYGVGVARDLVEAYAWLALAAGAGNADATAGRALVEKRMTQAQLDEGQRRATELAQAVQAAAQSSAAASSTTASSTGETPPPAGGDERTQALVDALRALANRAESDRSADFRVLRRLRELVQAYDRPWRVTLLDDDFSDGDFTRSPVWKVASGKFSVDPRYGLRSRVKLPATLNLGSGESGGGAALQFFGAVLGELTQQRGGSRAKRAEIHTKLAITDVFSIEIEFGTLSKAVEGGGIEFGPFRGAGRVAGYRLVYTQGANPSLAMLRVSKSGSTVIARATLETGLEDRQYHRLVLRRGHDGAMEVVLDGNPVMNGVDLGSQRRFTGFVLINKGGEFAVRRVTILGGAQ